MKAKTNPNLFASINVNGVRVPCKVVGTQRNAKGKLQLIVSVTATKKRTDRKQRETIVARRNAQFTRRKADVIARVPLTNGNTWAQRLNKVS